MKTIIVGIDGSHAAITAALWGVDEAISRAVPLRLVSVIKPTHPSPDDYDRDLAHAERSLREAQSAVEAAGKLVKIETDIRPTRARLALTTARWPSGGLLCPWYGVCTEVSRATAQCEPPSCHRAPRARHR